jgi:hypothetical protein
MSSYEKSHYTVDKEGHMTKKEIIPLPSVSIIQESEVPSLLSKIRPAWQSRDLIARVKRLITVDPSSACQRLFNAAVHDLKEKVIIAGIDIAKEVARQNGLPPIEKSEHVEEYSTARLIELSYHMGILSRAEWRRVSRCYEIRRDLEHEDDQYEAGVEDCIYIFKTCIEAILQRDPIHLIRVTDVKDLIQKPDVGFPAESLLLDYEHAPQVRQEEICRLLISIALDQKQSEVVRQNAYTFLRHFQPITYNTAKINLAQHLQERIRQKGLDKATVRVANAIGVLPYLKKANVRDYFRSLLKQMQAVGVHWSAFNHHGELLRSFQEVGGLINCPTEVRGEILKWLVLTFIGEPGGLTRYGHVRSVFYSDIAAPLISDLIKSAKDVIRSDISLISEDKDIQRACRNVHVARRFQQLLDLLA